MERGIHTTNSVRANRVRPRRALSAVVAVTFFCSLTACTKMEWKHHSSQYVGNLRQDLNECDEFKRARKLHFEEPPYDTGDPQRLEKLNRANSAMADDNSHDLVNSGLLSYDPEELLNHCMDYKGYRGKKTTSALGDVVVVVGIIAGVTVVGVGSAVLRAVDTLVD